MKKLNRLPREEVTGTTDEGIGPEHDARPDVEGHRVRPISDFGPGRPGTGGDGVTPGMPGGGEYRRPTGGGEIDDVEGHSFGHTKGERLGPTLPGTGGD
jgi:hypothetical protein